MSRHLILAGAALIALGACQKKADTTTANEAMAEANTPSEAAADSTPITLTDADRNFLEEAIKGDIGEVQIGQLAADRAQSDAARTYGQTLATDHGLHRGQLLLLAQRASMTAPTEPTTEAARNYSQLQAAAPKQFDAVFKGMMVEDHQKDIAKYKKQAEGSGPLADLARQTLPTLQKHLELAKAL